MQNAIITLICAFISIYLEFYLPGGIFGLIGAVLYLISFIFAYLNYPLIEFLIFSFIAILGLFLLIRFALWTIYKNKEKNTMYLKEDQEGFRACQFPQEMIGKTGVALCDISPSGYILIDNTKVSAMGIECIKKGETILVLSGEGSHLIVKLLKQEIK